jgi:hypothetical protein
MEFALTQLASAVDVNCWFVFRRAPLASPLFLHRRDRALSLFAHLLCASCLNASTDEYIAGDVQARSLPASGRCST